MKLIIDSPIKALLSEYTEGELYSLNKQLTYENTSVKFLIRKHQQNYIWKSRNRESWDNRLEALKKELRKTLVFNEDEKYYIRPGSIPYLEGFDLQVSNTINYPKIHKMPWKNPIPFELHPYQEESWQKLVEQKYGNVSLTTASGKSAIILKICRETGLNTVVVVPSKSIFEELLEKFEFHFGKKYVGTYGAGKKKLHKKITIAIGDSLANIKPDSEEDKFFKSLDMLVVDESHSFAAESLEDVCHGVLSDIPYRFFFSATQTRNDGSLPLLQSIIGKTVYSLSTKEAVEKGYICPHEFRIVEVGSDSIENSDDPLTAKRDHFLKNREICNFAAKLANVMATSQGKRTLVLVQELSQLAMIVPLIKVPFAIAHSEKNNAKLEELGLYKVDNAESVESFNKNESMVLLGTSCIATGTNIFTHFVVNWVGGSSEIVTKQGAIGRGVRKHEHNPWHKLSVYKDKCIIFDFDVRNQPILDRPLSQRIDFYSESGDNLIKYVKMKKE